MRLRGLRCLDSAIQGDELFLRHLLATQKRFDRSSQNSIDQAGR
jgi:hypothetical protein